MGQRTGDAGPQGQRSGQLGPARSGPDGRGRERRPRATGRDHEPPLPVVLVGFVTALVGLAQALVVPADDLLRHVLLGGAFAVVTLLCGWRVMVTTGPGNRPRRGARRCARVCLVVGVATLLILVYQSLVVLTDGTVPPPFWSPYAD